ncbi:MAG: phosphoglucosamine mutase [Rhodospirillales bacterium]
MGKSLFGTDGVRGPANTEPMTAATALRVGQAAGAHFTKGEGRHRAVIGKDTRLSGYMIENALVAGLVSVGMDAIQVGPMPTPAVGMLTRSMRADVGVMISASHNLYTDNGIKLFGPDGFKLSDDDEAAIETSIESGLDAALAAPDRIGRAKRIDDARGRYVEFVKAAFPKDLRLDGLKVVCDCAHGAAYAVAPEVLYELGAEVIPVGVSPDGFNINKDVGSTHPETMQAAVCAHGADLGLALDGDADRVLIADQNGALVDGDQIMALIARDWLAEGRLRGGRVVGTQMTNLGFERWLKENKLGLTRTAVGDRYVVQAMRESGANMGGEPSGHIILTDYSTTGDGLIAALQTLAVLARTGRDAASVCNVFEHAPQVLVNVKTQNRAALNAAPVQKAVAAAEADLGAAGRVLVRPSGTEPLIRVMAEADSQAAAEQACARIADAIRAAG